MPHQLHWRELKGGIIAVGVIAALVLSILAFARVGGLRGKKVTLYVVTEEAAGVLSGTEVWVSGEKDGLVTDISFRPITTDTLERLLIKTEVLAEALPNIRRDSYAQIRPGGTLIGTPIIYISAGTVTSPAVMNGDTIHARHGGQIGGIAEGVAALAPEVGALGAAGRQLMEKTRRPVGTIGNMRVDGLSDLPDVVAGVSSLNARSRRDGTLARAMRGSLQRRVSQALAAADSIRRLVASNKGNLGRFRKDSTLMRRTGHVLAELDTLRALVGSPLGTIAAVHSDSALTRKLDEQRQLMAALMRDMKSNPLRYVRF